MMLNIDMAIRFTEKELKDAGFVKDGKGEYRTKGSPACVLTESSAKPKPNIRRRVKAPAPDESTDEGGGGSSRNFGIEVAVYSRRHRDPDNIFPKYILDELVRREVIPDDSSRYIRWIRKGVFKVETREEEKTIIQVVEL
jgi:hypothetical protein